MATSNQQQADVDQAAVRMVEAWSERTSERENKAVYDAIRRDYSAWWKREFSGD